MQFCKGGEQLSGADLLLSDASVCDHFIVFLGDGDVCESLAVDLHDIVWGEEVHVVSAPGEFEYLVGEDDSEGEGLDADFLVSVFALGVEEFEDVRVVCREVHGSCALTGSELVYGREDVFVNLHPRDNAFGES